MNGKLRSLWVTVLLLVVLLAGGVGGAFVEHQVLAASAGPAVSSSAVPEMPLLLQAWNIIQQDYVDRPAVQPQQMIYGAIDGMVASLGDTGHSRFLSPGMLKEEQSQTQGHFQGIGIEVEEKDGHLVVVAPLDNSPAQQAGIRPGDIIVRVDGQNVEGLPIDQVVGRVMGPAGTSVTLTLVDPASGQSRDVTLQRADIQMHNVTWSRLPGTTIADVRIDVFSTGVSQDLQKALQEIERQGLTGVILDLRSSPGGLLDEAIGTVSQFVGQGNVLLERDAQGKVTAIPVRSGGVARDIPLVVLVNQGTASAAEIVAGALQDAHRATIVGKTTFGTGTVLKQFDLADGSALLLATEEWLTPAGRTIWHQGISPDVTVTQPQGAIPLLPSAGLTSEQLRSSTDAQLHQALDLLTGPAHQ